MYLYISICGASFNAYATLTLKYAVSAILECRLFSPAAPFSARQGAYASTFSHEINVTQTQTSDDFL